MYFFKKSLFIVEVPMKNIIFLLGLLTACGCEPSELDVKTGKVDTGDKTPTQAEPVGVIPADDCQQIDIGDKACNFTLLDQNGDIWELYQHTGDVIVLDFSAVWCYPCQLAAPHAQKIQDDYADQGVQMVTVLIDGRTPGEEPTSFEVTAWANTHNLTSAPVLQGSREKMLDPQDGSIPVEELGITGYLLNAYPTYLYIGRDMKFISGHVGFSEEYIREKIEGAL
tara:strand:- start:289 stop:963 length:675 start_codon:yes stop_codon:yes gene_type:complete